MQVRCYLSSMCFVCLGIYVYFMCFCFSAKPRLNILKHVGLIQLSVLLRFLLTMVVHLANITILHHLMHANALIVQPTHILVSGIELLLV